MTKEQAPAPEEEDAGEHAIQSGRDHTRTATDDAEIHEEVVARRRDQPEDAPGEDEAEAREDAHEQRRRIEHFRNRIVETTPGSARER
jgi:hypothetical protein